MIPTFTSHSNHLRLALVFCILANGWLSGCSSTTLPVSAAVQNYSNDRGAENGRVEESPGSIRFTAPTSTLLPLSSEPNISPKPNLIAPTPTPTLINTPSSPNSAAKSEEFRQLKFNIQMDALFHIHCGEWAVMVKEINGNTIYTRNPQKVIHPASVIKIPTGILLLKWVEQQQPANFVDFLKTKGTNGRTFYQLLRAMVVNTEEEATRILTEYLSTRINAYATFKEWGLTKTSLLPRTTTVEEMSLLFENLYTGKLLSPASTQLMLNLMEEYTPNDDIRLGSIRRFFPSGFHMYNKRGSITKGMVIVADAAIFIIPLKAKTGEYIFEIFGAIPPEAKTCTYESLDSTIKKSSLLFVDYLQTGVGKKENEAQ